MNMAGCRDWATSYTGLTPLSTTALAGYLHPLEPPTISQLKQLPHTSSIPTGLVFASNIQTPEQLQMSHC